MNANELADELVGLIVAPTPVDDKWACELIDKAATMLRQLQTKVDGLQYNADLHTKKIHWLAINYPDVNNHLFETIKTGEIYDVEEK